MSINVEWHKKNKMPMPTTLAQRVRWHEEHLKHCDCRKDVPPTILAELKKQGKMIDSISGGTVHTVPEDLQKALVSDTNARAEWESLTPLARNEWICWTISVHKEETRRAHVTRVVGELKEGVRRPCCWIGCMHRKDKAVSPSVKHIVNKRQKKRGV